LIKTDGEDEGNQALVYTVIMATVTILRLLVFRR
jgi:hypothetical protein